ncbi:hypothetical protein VE03_07093 [Pseudogymnoascus sp. 23342-1-I1]|nr:hypothetical protein VE03_07093 [Pseudogymnoascus sp. 23342-1-I1]
MEVHGIFQNYHILFDPEACVATDFTALVGSDQIPFGMPDDLYDLDYSGRVRQMFSWSWCRATHPSNGIEVAAATEVAVTRTVGDSRIGGDGERAGSGGADGPYVRKVHTSARGNEVIDSSRFTMNSSICSASSLPYCSFDEKVLGI